MGMSACTTRGLIAVVAIAVAAGCASTPPAPNPEPLLLAAGFKTVTASTDKQIQHLPTLPAGQVTVITQTGKNWYVYPDLPKNQLYVGTAKEYQAYLKLRTQNNLPPPSDPAGVSMAKADTAMLHANMEDIENPWLWWPDFSGLPWTF